MKKYLLAFSLLAISTSLFAEVKLGESGVAVTGSVELDLFGRTNNQGKNGEKTTTSGMEVATTINLDGKHESDFGNLIWRAAGKMATDWRYDSFGMREAWAGVDNKYGKFIAGNQFSNMYLAMDWPYGAQGMGNLFGDMGAHEVQYTRAISYATPTLAGFKLTGQYDIGGYGKNTNGGLYDGIIEKSYAYELLLNYNNDSLRADLGYYNGTNNGTLDFFADAFNGSRSQQGSKVSALHNTSQVYLASLVYKISAFDLILAYKHNIWDGETASYDTSGKGSNDHGLVRVGYTFLEKNNVNLGYQQITEGKDDSGVVVSSIDAINFQYNRTISPNAVAFVQIRHQMYGKEGAQISTDGKLLEPDDVTRFLIGYWVGF